MVTFKLKYHSFITDSNKPYHELLKMFSFFHDRQKIIRGFPEEEAKIVFEINHKIFDKTLNMNDENHQKIKEKLLRNINNFHNEKEEFYIKMFKPYLKKLILDDLTGKVYDFTKNEEITKEYFDREDFSLNEIKKLLDFLRCNKFYEDIPIYKKEYSEFIKNMKEFLVKYYNHSSTYQDDVCYIRLENFFKQLIEIVEEKDSTYNIFINHNTAIRSFIKFFLSEEGYQILSDSCTNRDEDFFVICPKFSAEYKMLITDDKKMKLFILDRDITNYLKKEFLIRQEGEDFVDYFKFKEYLISHHNLLI